MVNHTPPDLPAGLPHGLFGLVNAEIAFRSEPEPTADTEQSLCGQHHATLDQDSGHLIRLTRKEDKHHQAKVERHLHTRTARQIISAYSLAYRRASVCCGIIYRHTRRGLGDGHCRSSQDSGKSDLRSTGRTIGGVTFHHAGMEPPRGPQLNLVITPFPSNQPCHLKTRASLFPTSACVIGTVSREPTLQCSQIIQCGL